MHEPHSENGRHQALCEHDSKVARDEGSRCPGQIPSLSGTWEALPLPGALVDLLIPNPSGFAGKLPDRAEGTHRK